MKSIFCLAAMAAPLCALSQTNKPQTLQPPIITPNRIGAQQTGSTSAASSAAKPAPNPAASDAMTQAGTPAYTTVQQAPGLLSYAPVRQQTGPYTQRKDMLALPMLGGIALAGRLIAPGSLYEPPVVDRDASGRPIQAGQEGTQAPPDPNSRWMQRPPLLVSQFMTTEFIQRAPESIITPAILGFTDYARAGAQQTPADPRQPVGPTFTQHLAANLAPGTYVIEPVMIGSLAPVELNYASADDARIRDPYFRIASAVGETRVLPWTAMAGMPQSPAPEPSAFRLPRAIANMVNVNLNFGLGIPNYMPNLGSLMYGSLGLGGAFDYLSPEVTDRLQPRNNYQPR